MAEKIKTLQQNREEALATHKLARSRMTNRRNLTFTPFKQGNQVWLDSQNLKTHYQQKDEAEKRRTIHYYGGTRTGHLPTKPTSNLVNSQRIPRHPTATLQRERSLRSQLPRTTTRATRRGGGNDLEPSKTRTRLPIPHQMARIPNFWCIVGTRNIIFVHGDTLEHYKLRHGLKWTWTIQNSDWSNIQCGKGTMENQKCGRRHNGIILGYKTVPRLRRRSRNHSYLHHPASQLTVSSPSLFSSRSPERHSTWTTPSLYDLHNIILDRNLPTLLDQAFQPGHASTSDLQHFYSLTWTIQQPEQDLAHYQAECDTIF